MNEEQVRRAVRDQYGAIARGEGALPQAAGEAASACCDSTSCCSDASATSFAEGYSSQELAALPEGADLGLGCGNPGAIAALAPGEAVLDLGSGGGIDCFLAARQVGADGRVIGVDMTPDMIERARKNAAEAGATNVEFRLGEIENLPVADGAIDVILSNCVINLSVNKRRVFEEAFRVLKPGGRLAISDMIANAEIPASLKEDLALYTGCIAGAATRAEIENWLREAGFVDVNVTPRTTPEPPAGGDRPTALDYVRSASIEAVRPPR